MSTGSGQAELLDQNDAYFSKLRIFQDFNQNGQSDPGGLFSWQDAGHALPPRRRPVQARDKKAPPGLRTRKPDDAASAACRRFGLRRSRPADARASFRPMAWNTSISAFVPTSHPSFLTLFFGHALRGALAAWIHLSEAQVHADYDILAMSKDSETMKDIY